MRISDWSSDVCSSDLADAHQQRMQAPCIGAGDAEAEAAQRQLLAGLGQVADRRGDQATDGVVFVVVEVGAEALVEVLDRGQRVDHVLAVGLRGDQRAGVLGVVRSAEHTFELQYLLRLSYAVFCLTKKKHKTAH